MRLRPGLSPRVRGNLDGHRRHGEVVGSIPACAGEPTRRLTTSTHGPVYPRVCGGTPPTRFSYGAHSGLSPRVRGNREHRQPKHHRPRSIPACAGEPPAWRASYSPCRVYPRVCGGTVSVQHIVQGRSGLSPRVRGNLVRRQCAMRSHGSIPACAGEPITTTPPPTLIRVYPRVCGGTPLTEHVPLPGGGLSPRVRGNRFSEEDTQPRSRSIPACAGEPGGGCGSRDAERVYPRVCGGTSASA